MGLAAPERRHGSVIFTLIMTTYPLTVSSTRPYLLGVISSDDIDTYTPLPSRDQTITSHFKSRTQSLDSSASTSPERLSISLHESHSEALSTSPNFSDDDDLFPHPDEHQVQLDTNRSFVLYPIGETPRSYVSDILLTGFICAVICTGS